MDIFALFDVDAKNAILNVLFHVIAYCLARRLCGRCVFGRFLGHALGFVQVTHPFQAYRIKYVIYLMMDGQTKLWSGAHDGIRAVAAVADQDIRAAGFFKVQAFLCLTGAVAGIFTFQRALYINGLFAFLNQYNVCIHFLCNILHARLISTACAEQDAKLCVFKIFKRCGDDNATGGFGDRCV